MLRNVSAVCEYIDRSLTLLLLLDARSRLCRKRRGNLWNFGWMRERERERELVFKFQSPMTVKSGRERERESLTSFQPCMTVIYQDERAGERYFFSTSSQP